MGCVHQLAQFDRSVGRLLQTIEQRGEAVHARLFADGMLGRAPHRITTLRPDHGRGVGDAAVALQELCTRHLVWQQTRDLTEFLRCEVAEICAAPGRIGCQNPQSHERGGSHYPVVGPRHGVTDS